MATIKCIIKNCSHNESGHSCGLPEVIIGTHEANPTQVECTDCQSFELDK
ncbi:MAG: DUF1540 domain-containing protein [Turicibacter sp.]|nr:DUF1540 domain-containing protein [Turicibacter sp.]